MQFRLIVVLMLFLLCAGASYGGMSPVTDPELAGVRAATGVSLHISSEMSAEYYRITNPDNGHYLEFQDIVMDDGSGGAWETNGAIIIDAGTSGTRPCLRMTIPDTLSSGSGTYLSAESIELNGDDAGSLYIDNLKHSETHYLISGHTDGSVGMDLSLRTRWNVEKIAYEIGGDEFSLNGVYLSQSPGGDADDPSLGSGLAVIGAGSWAHLDFGSDASSSYIMLDIPVQGTLRFDNVALAGQSYGPTAADNLDGTIRVRIPAGATWQY